MKLFIHNLGNFRGGKPVDVLINWHGLNGFTWRFYKGWILVCLIPARSAKARGGLTT